MTENRTAFFLARRFCLFSGLLFGIWLIPVSGADNPQPAEALTLRYSQPAPDTIKGWEENSLPLGNGYFGVSVFGGVEDERLQLTDKALYARNSEKKETDGDKVAFSSFADIRLHFSTAGEVQDYKRTLDLAQAIAKVNYKIGDASYLREMFASYPDRVFAMRLTSSKKDNLNFTIKAELPFLDEFRTGQVSAEGNRIVFSIVAKPYGYVGEGQCQIAVSGGSVKAIADGIEVKNADKALILVSIGSNYQMKESVFLPNEDDQRLQGLPLPHETVSASLDSASKKSWDTLLAAHLADYKNLFSRVELQLGESAGNAKQPLDTDALLADYKKTPGNPALEALYFQYGRYLLIASSRKGCLPANLQGTWNALRGAKWTGGYFCNINLQMNYWPTFSANLAETFEPYLAYFEASLKKRGHIAAHIIKTNHPESPSSDCGWTAGTNSLPYYCSWPNRTSGFGTGPFITQNMWEYYDFTRDKEVLKRVWPLLRGASLFTSKVVKQIPGYGDLLLCDPSYSPETMSQPDRKYINLPGTAYDQSLIYEGHLRTLEAAKILGIANDPLLDTIRKQLPLLDPIQVGESGQIKEFRQEKEYAEFGEPHHRHISQLIGLYPGRIINSGTPEWMAAARVSLEKRGDQSTGWAMAHRLNCWARLQDGERAYVLLKNLISKGTLPNLWDTHPPFQIDGNFGGTAGIVEMLMQSHAGFIQLLPACPAAWSTGKFKGLMARGNFEVSAEWRNGAVTSVDISSHAGGECVVKLDKATSWRLDKGSAKLQIDGGNALRFMTVAGQVYRLRR